MEHERGAYQKLMLSYREMEDQLENIKTGGVISMNSVDPNMEAIMSQQTLDIQKLQEELASEKSISKKATTELYQLKSDYNKQQLILTEITQQGTDATDKATKAINLENTQLKEDVSNMKTQIDNLTAELNK